MVLNTILDFVFAPIISLNPALSIFLISSLVSLTMVFVNKKTLWSKEAKAIQEKMKQSQKIKDEIVSAQKKKNTKKVEELTKKSLEMQSKYMSEYMKYSMKPLLISIMLAIIVFPWLNMTYKKIVVITVPQFIPLIGGIGLTWIWWYIICSLIISLLGKKIFEDKK